MKIAPVLQPRVFLIFLYVDCLPEISKEKILLQNEATSAVSLTHTPDYRLSGSSGRLFLCNLGKRSLADIT